MRLSLITACYNAERTVMDALLSVMSQRTGRDAADAERALEIECIVVDGGSVDGTPERIKKEGEAAARKAGVTLKWVSERDRGMYDALNKGIRMATGDVVGILNADDVLASDDVLAKVAAAFCHSEIDGTYADVRFVRGVDSASGFVRAEGGDPEVVRRLPTVRYCSGRWFRPWMFRFGVQTAHPSTFFRRECFAKWGEYSLGYGMFGDFELLCRFIWKNRARMKYLPMCTTVMRMGGASTGGWRTTVKINASDLSALRDNGCWSCLPLLYLRYLFKIWGFVIRGSSAAGRWRAAAWLMGIGVGRGVADMTRTGMRGLLTGTLAVLFGVLLHSASFALDISNRYRSPRNPERRARTGTELIVLHTTEAPARSSLNKLSDRGEAHFCVTEEGGVYAIVDRDRVAFHAGRSMWNGKEDVDSFSIGIECVGYHNKPMPMPQLVAIRDLVSALQRMYRVTDDRVVCHSHVAYGSPNKWQKRKHRGRKRCGMLFAMPSVRRILGLRYRPGGDVDTRTGRLAIGDPYLQQVLYGNVDTMVASYSAVVPKSPAPVIAKPPVIVKRPPPAKPPVIVKRPPPAKPPVPTPVPQPAPAKPPVVVKPSVPTPPAKPALRSIAQLMLAGYEEKGTVTKTTSALKIAGGKWNSPDTYYTIRGKVIPGNAINASRIENGMGVWMKK